MTNVGQRLFAASDGRRAMGAHRLDEGEVAGRPRDPLALGAIAEPDDLADPLAQRPALVAELIEPLGVGGGDVVADRRTASVSEQYVPLCPLLRLHYVLLGDRRGPPGPSRRRHRRRPAARSAPQPGPGAGRAGRRDRQARRLRRGRAGRAGGRRLRPRRGGARPLRGGRRSRRMALPNIGHCRSPGFE